MSEALSPSPSEASGTHRLPTIPTLPPIEIPKSNFHASLNAVDDGSTLRVREPEDNQLDSAPLSEESYATACTSPLATPAENFTTEALNPTRPAQSVLPHTLPKSFSVDSFIRIQQRRDSTPAESARTTAGGPSTGQNRPSPIDPEMELWRDEQRGERLTVAALSPGSSNTLVSPAYRTLAQRVKRQSRLERGSGYSTAEDSSAYEDSELEQGRSTPKGPEGRVGAFRRRLILPKRSGSMPATSEPGQLPVPARTRRLSAAVHKTSYANTETNPTARLTNLMEQPPALRNKVSAPTPLDHSRVRSQSTGAQPNNVQSNNVQSNNARKRCAKPAMKLRIDTDIHSKDGITITLGIVGARGCGKTSFINRAWKGYHVGHSQHRTVEVNDECGSWVIGYVCRTAHMPTYFEGEDIFVSFIEIRLEALLHPDGNFYGTVWPSTLPKIDGLCLLYDSSDRSTFAHVEELTHGCFNLKMPFIILACKSDIFPHQIQPVEASIMAMRYNGGIVEISSNSAGREKAHRCAEVLIKSIMRKRRGSIDLNLNPFSPILHSTTPAPWERERRKSTIHPPSLPLHSGNGAMAIGATIHNATITTSSISIPDPPRQHPPPHIPLPPPPYSLAGALPSTAPTFLSIPTSAPTPALPVMSTTISPMTVAEPRPAPSLQPSSASASPTRARSMSDLVSEHNKLAQTAKQAREHSPELVRSRSIVDMAKTIKQSTDVVQKDSSTTPSSLIEDNEEPVLTLKRTAKQPQPAPWATLDELLEKLFFLSVSGDDPSYIDHFFLTFRRFTTPRRILLAMQKRMLELNQSPGDPTLASYAQLRICNLLEQWMRDFPTDFAVPGTAGALNALIKQILKQTHTLYYGSDLLPFLEMLPTRQDQDSAWAIASEVSINESDESDSNFDGESEETTPATASSSYLKSASSIGSPRPSGRERKSSLPLAVLHAPVPSNPPLMKDLIVRLLKSSNALSHFDSEDIAKEITRRELELYMQIEPRDWLRHTLLSGRKDPTIDKIARFNNLYNHLHDWAASMILCHDRPKARARIVEKLADVAVKLRNMNNYSGLRALITAITQATYPNDEVMEIFRTKTELYKKYLSSDILMRTAGSHQSYRLALRNTKGPCIPCLEVHTSDLRRAHEGNPDYKSDDPSKIHWAKFNMIGKFVGTTTQLQSQCRDQSTYTFTENQTIGQHFDIPVMDYDMQLDRLGPPPEDIGDMYSAHSPPIMSLDHSAHPRDGVIRRLFFWS